jgi:hypothetical protein
MDFVVCSRSLVLRPSLWEWTKTKTNATKHHPKIFRVWYFLEVYQTGYPVWYTVPNANKTPTTNKTRIHVSPTTAQFSINLATSSEQPWRSFQMQTTINHSNNGLLNTVILIFHVLHFFQSCRLLSSGSNSRFYSKWSRRRWAIQASERHLLSSPKTARFHRNNVA